MSDDELNLLSLLLQRHGARAVIAALSLACGRQANEAAEDGDFHAEQRWKSYAERLRDDPQQMITITKYARRHWAVYAGADLVCVTVYKKGAEAVKQRLEQHPSTE